MKSIRALVETFRDNEHIKLKYLFYFFKICGLAPIDVNIEMRQDKNTNKCTFTYSRRYFTINLVIISLSTSFCGIALYLYQLSGLYREAIYDCVADCFGFVSVIIIIVTFTVKCKKQISILNDIDEIRERISDSHESYEEHEISKKIALTLSMYLLYWLGLVSTLFFFGVNRTIIYLLFDISHFIINMMVIQYSIVVEFIKHLIVKLNENLIRTTKHVGYFNGVSTTSTDDIDRDLALCWKLHADLSKVSIELSRYYSFRMLLVIISAFFIATAITYDLVKSLFFKGSFSIAIQYIGAISFILAYMIPLVLLTTSVSAVLHENDKTHQIVNDYLRESNSRVVKERLIQFSIYLLYRNIDFVAFEFFPLDTSLLISIIGTSVTYLVVLLQFQQRNYATRIEHHNHSFSSTRELV